MVRKVNSLGIVSTFAGTGTPGYSGDGGPAVNAQITDPYSIAVDAIGNVYIADLYNNVIRKVDTFGIISNFAGNGTIGHAGDGGPAFQAQLTDPAAVATDNNGNVYFAENDHDNPAIRRVNTGGIITKFAGNLYPGYSGDGGQAVYSSISEISAIACDNAGNVYLTGISNDSAGIGLAGIVRKIDRSGIISTFAGITVSGYSGDGGPAINAQFFSTSGLATDNNGNVYISDYANNTVRKVNTAGIITTFAGNSKAGYSGDGGPAVQAKLNAPKGLATDNAGNVYVADYYNNVIRKIYPCIISPFIQSTDTSICQGAPLSLPSGKIIATPAQAIYLDTLQTVLGCDSIIDTFKIRIDTPQAFNRAVPLCPANQDTLTAISPGSYLWSTGATGNAIVVTNADTYTLHIVDSNGCTALDSFRVVAYNNPVLNFAGDTAVCNSGLTKLDAGDGYKTYLWNTGSAQQSITIHDTGNYWVSVTDTNGCKASDTIYINTVLPSPSHFLVADTSMCIYNVLQVSPDKSFPTYLWSNGATTFTNTIDSTGTYWLMVTDANGCAGYDTVVVSPTACFGSITMPNAFTPNGDGHNDIFKPSFKGNISIAHYKLAVFNRYGQLVFESNDISRGWDGAINGSMQNTGTYVWMVEYQFANGRAASEKGTVLLIK